MDPVASPSSGRSAIHVVIACLAGLVAAVGVSILMVRVCNASFRGPAPPKDMAMVTIQGLPVDTEFLCILMLGGESPRQMGLWQRSGGGIDWKWRLRDDCSGKWDSMDYSGDGQDLSTRYFAWRDSPRYGVLRRSLRGKWLLLWVDASKVGTGGAPTTAPLGRRNIPYEASRVETPTADFLVSVGITAYLPGSPEAEESSRAPDESVWKERALTDAKSFLSLLGEVRKYCEFEVNWPGACSQVSRICFAAPRLLERTAHPTTEQVAAATELESSYESFVAALTRGQDDAKLVLDRLELLVRTIAGQ